MSSETLITKVPYEKGHAHFYDSIAAFPDLPTGPTFQQRQQYIKDSIKYQLLTGNKQKANRFINLRECFKFDKRKYVQFCLNEKVPGVAFEEAARQLGYRK